ncbi:PhzF family phenazine biosynthesis protein [Deinococcus rubellus]|uniref:PhzF family phenazine biosynthesis protein n=1 Tax=Deinococcus rubellus TaxID=1889240 RepID=A0ABY5YD57_9DEIO|nr:PhzF family phenazine biosynthesis protein [Deinococcus rubellus]UWX62974.1 PhzF family phenazine biosynthesis protein [Deinococcus rubellus]
MTGLSPLPYRVYAAPRTEGGKLASLFVSAGGDLQAQAARAGTPLSVFIERLDEHGAHLRVFTPTRDKGDSDSAALVALHHLYAEGRVPDVSSVWMNGQEYPAQLCGGEWLLKQGDVSVTGAPDTDFGPLRIQPEHVQVASAGRPNLVVGVPSLDVLTHFRTDVEALSQLGRETQTTGFILYTLDAERTDVAFRAFGPLRGFDEDAASSNMFACLVGALSMRGALPEGEPLVRGLQMMPGVPSRLSAQYAPQAGGASDVWVGGTASRLNE